MEGPIPAKFAADGRPFDGISGCDFGLWGVRDWGLEVYRV